MCAFYMKTATCKYGATCKFDHPPPGELVAMVNQNGTSSTEPGATEPGTEDRNPENDEEEDEGEEEEVEGGEEREEMVFVEN